MFVQLYSPGLGLHVVLGFMLPGFLGAFLVAAVLKLSSETVRTQVRYQLMLRIGLAVVVGALYAAGSKQVEAGFAVGSFTALIGEIFADLVLVVTKRRD